MLRLQIENKKGKIAMHRTQENKFARKFKNINYSDREKKLRNFSLKSAVAKNSDWYVDTKNYAEDIESADTVKQLIK